MRGDLLDYRRQHDARSADGKSRSRDEPRKASFLEKFLIYDAPSPYRKPTQVDKRKYAKVNGWDLVKELGKSVAVSSQYGLPASCRLQQTYFNRLFIKNTAPC